jgi:glycosyltransferase involved in cell wall biosynthesis
MGTKGKGIEAAIKTLRLLDERHTLDLIVFPTPLFAVKIKFLARLLGVSNRLTVKPGVPLAELPLILNAYDVALIIMSNVTSGHLNALPNKLFESIQSKLAIVTGPNPAMRTIVQKYELGLSLDSWNPEEAASVINSTAAKSWSRHKSNSRIASQKLSSRQSRLVFKQILSALS